MSEMIVRIQNVTKTPTKLMQNFRWRLTNVIENILVLLSCIGGYLTITRWSGFVDFILFAKLV